MMSVAWLAKESNRLHEEGMPYEDQVLMWISPSWELCTRGLSFLARSTLESGGPNPLNALYEDDKRSYGDMRVDLKTGATIKFYTSERNEQIEGEGIHLCVLDEAGHIKDGAWYESIYPALGMSKGKALITGKPKGRNWYHEVWLKAQDPLQEDYWGIQAPSDVNPHLPPDFVEEAKRDLPRRVYEQEIQARFLDDAGSVFRNVRSLITTSDNYRGPAAAEGWALQAPEPGVKYVAGWDPAKHQDYSTLTILRLPERHVVHFDRFQTYEYDRQVARVADALRRYNNAPLLMDSSGIGDPLYDFMCRAYDGEVEGYKFTNTTKADLVNELALVVDHGDVCFPDLPVLVNELEIFEMEKTPAGNVRYNAPEGQHDDGVDSLALGVMKSKRGGLGVVDNDDLQEIFQPAEPSGGVGRGGALDGFRRRRR